MKQNKMQIPEGYKNSSLGIIPNDWEVKRLGILCQLKSGQDLIPEGYSDTIGKYPYVTGASSLCNHSGIIFNRWTDTPTSIAIKGDILLVCKGSGVGRLTILDNADEAHIARQIMSIRPKVDIERDFLYFQLKLLVDSIKKRARGVIPGIDRGSILSLKLLIPPLPQQQKIAEILGIWDEAIEKQSKLIDKLTDRKRGLMQQLLTGKKRLAGFSEEWKEVRLGEIGERVVRKNTEKNHNVITISAQQGFVSQKDYFNKTIASEVTDNYYLIHKDEFCYNKSYSAGYPMGAIKRLKTFDKAVVTTLYICFKLKENISKDFFEQFAEGGHLINGLVKVANEGGRAHGLLNVTPVDFFNIKFTLPSLPEQTAIANILTAADKEIELAKSKLELLRSQKSGLMQQLLTGKTRVKID